MLSGASPTMNQGACFSLRATAKTRSLCRRRTEGLVIMRLTSRASSTESRSSNRSGLCAFFFLFVCLFPLVLDRNLLLPLLLHRVVFVSVALRSPDRIHTFIRARVALVRHRREVAPSLQRPTHAMPSAFCVSAACDRVHLLQHARPSLRPLVARSRVHVHYMPMHATLRLLLVRIHIQSRHEGQPFSALFPTHALASALPNRIAHTDMISLTLSHPPCRT